VEALEERVDLADREGLSELYRINAPDAVRVAYLLTGDRELAQDLVQEAFVRCIGRLGQLRQRDAFPGYLRTTVLNLARMHFRRRKLERSRLEQMTIPSEESRGIDVADTQALRVSLLALPYRQRAAIVLRYYCELPDSETAAVLRCAVPTVRSLISRGLEQLRVLAAEA
jgi:RNA polymerase sigma factor (sigma-70 family)